MLHGKPGGYKKSAHLNDGKDIGINLAGGFYDAGGEPAKLRANFGSRCVHPEVTSGATNMARWPFIAVHDFSTLSGSSQPGWCCNKALMVRRAALLCCSETAVKGVLSSAAATTNAAEWPQLRCQTMQRLLDACQGANCAGQHYDRHMSLLRVQQHALLLLLLLLLQTT